MPTSGSLPGALAPASLLHTRLCTTALLASHDCLFSIHQASEPLGNPNSTPPNRPPEEYRVDKAQIDEVWAQHDVSVAAKQCGSKRWRQVVWAEPGTEPCI